MSGIVNPDLIEDLKKRYWRLTEHEKKLLKIRREEDPIHSLKISVNRDNGVYVKFIYVVLYGKEHARKPHDGGRIHVSLFDI